MKCYIFKEKKPYEIIKIELHLYYVHVTSDLGCRFQSFYHFILYLRMLIIDTYTNKLG